MICCCTRCTRLGVSPWNARESAVASRTPASRRLPMTRFAIARTCWRIVLRFLAMAVRAPVVIAGQAAGRGEREQNGALADAREESGAAAGAGRGARDDGGRARRVDAGRLQ